MLTLLTRSSFSVRSDSPGRLCVWACVWQLMSRGAVMQLQCDWPPLSCPLTFSTHALSPLFIWQSAPPTRAHRAVVDLLCFLFACTLSQYVCVCLLMERLQLEMMHSLLGRVWMWGKSFGASVWLTGTVLGGGALSCDEWWICLFRSVLFDSARIYMFVLRVSDWNQKIKRGKKKS